MGYIVALGGNPNVGKSTVFNALTGGNQHTGNWPGKTVASARGNYTRDGEEFELVDLPGTYSLMAHSVEEEVARDFLCTEKPDAVVLVCDATCLRRNLNLVLQTLEITTCVVLCVNLMDEAEKKGISVDLGYLSELLGIPVVGAAARQGQGLEELMEQISKVCRSCGDRTETGGTEGIPLEEDEKVQKLIASSERIGSEVTTYKKANWNGRDRKIDRILTGRLTGVPIMLLLLCLIFWITVSGANVPSSLLSTGLFWIQERLTEFFHWIGAPEIVHGILVLGIYRVLAWVVSVMLPPMMIFFPLFTLLEDFGYLPRIAFVLDKPFKKCCACGKQALTM